MVKPRKNTMLIEPTILDKLEAREAKVETYLAQGISSWDGYESLSPEHSIKFDEMRDEMREGLVSPPDATEVTEGTVAITISGYVDLLESSSLLALWEANGVDDWEGYESA